MKQSLKVIIFSCLVGGILAGMFFLNVKNKAEAKSKPLVYAFQVGVFKNYNNALNMQKSYQNAKIVKDKDVYRLFIGITGENSDLLKEILGDNDYYYVKEISLTDDVYANILKFDRLLRETAKENQKEVIKQMLGILPDEL